MPAQKDEGGWSKFVWDSEKKEFLGRTGGSWCKYEFSYNIYLYIPPQMCLCFLGARRVRWYVV